jgi:hypothetical protein
VKPDEDVLTLDKLGYLSRWAKAVPGLQLHSNPHLLDGPFEDWSEVRSPSRAARRRRQGHPQRIRTYYLPAEKAVQFERDGVVHIVMHPAKLAELKAEIDRRRS